MVEFSKNAARKTKQAVTEYLARTGGGPGAQSPFHFDQPKLGKCLEAISSGASGLVQIYSGNRETAKGSETSSGPERQLKCYSRGHDFAADDWCLIVRVGGTGLEILPFSGGGECACEEVHEFTTTGAVTGGTWSMQYTINSVTESISSLDDQIDADALQTAIEGHSEVASGDVECFGGDFPDTALYCKFTGNLANMNIPLPALDSSSLTGTGAKVKVRKASAYDWS
jgi:hypothetical protein